MPDRCRRRTTRARLLSAALLCAGLLAACGGSGDDGGADASVASGAAAGAAPGAAARQHQLVSAADAPMVLAGTEGIEVLDVRTPAEFAEGHIEGATVIDYNAPGFEEAVGKLDRSVPYFVYCHSGNRSAGAVAVMTALGFERLYELDGGIVAWQAASQPLTTA